jgi:predicted PurR-regulated permease PerM
MNENHVERAFFVALLLAVTLAFLWLIRGFLQPIFWAIALGIVVYPLHARLVPRVRNRESLAAALSMLAVVVVVILPLLGVAAAVTSEGAALYQRLQVGDLGVQRLYEQTQETMPQITALLERFGVDPARLQEQLSSAAITAGQFFASRALSLGQNTLRVTVVFFLML